MPSRMRRVWVPFRSGVTAIPGLSDARLFLTDFIDIAMDRKLTQYTVTRMIFGFSCAVNAGAQAVMSLGVRFENTNVPIGTVGPTLDSTASWLYWEEVMSTVGAGEMHQSDRIIRDIATQRKTTGNDQELFFYITNTGAVAGTLMLSGRALVLIP